MKGGGVSTRGLDRRMHIGAWSARSGSDAGTPRAAWKPWRFGLAAAVALVALLVAPALSWGHIERASYWPDPAPDCSISPCAGGAVPTPRSLQSALATGGPGVTRVVCQPDSIKRLEQSVAAAQSVGYVLRPTQPRVKITRTEGTALLKLNRELSKRCKFNSIQGAVTASSNNDRVVVMPGLYTEPQSREAPTNDPRCAQYRIENDRGETGAVSYEYQFNCPNDQNLIAVLGRLPGPTPPPQPPLSLPPLSPPVSPWSGRPTNPAAPSPAERAPQPRSPGP